MIEKRSSDCPPTSVSAASMAANEGFDPRWLGAVVREPTWHFHRRLFERYGIILGPADYSRISISVARGLARQIRPGPDGTAVYLVQVPTSGALVFVGAKPGGELITAMPVTERLLDLVRLQLQSAPKGS